MDVQGFVFYAPTLSVAGLRNKVPMSDMSRMLTGKMPSATSQLVVDKPFILRHLARGHGPEVLDTTLKCDELRRQRTRKYIRAAASIEAQISASASMLSSNWSEGLAWLQQEGFVSPNPQEPSGQTHEHPIPTEAACQT